QGKVVDKNHFKLASEARYTDGFYNGMKILIDGKHRYRILSYNGRDQIAEVTPELAKELTADRQYTYKITPPPLVPVYAWKETLKFWIPLVLFLWLALFGLSFVFHKQWSEHEHLPYPIATFTDMLLPENDSGIAGLLKQRGFQIATMVVLGIYIYNYTQSWFSNYLVAIPLKFDFWGIIHLFPILKGPVYQIASIRIYFTVIAIAYFLASDVALSLGLSKYVFCFTVGALGMMGVNLFEGGGTDWTQYNRYLGAGAYLGAFIMFLYTGRYYYLNVCKRVVGLRTSDEVPAYSVWGARLFFLCMFGFVVWLHTQVHFHWFFALLYFFGVLVMYSVMSRIIAETGLFFIQTNFLPGGLLIGLLGTRALSPEMIAVLTFAAVQLSIDPREALMPFMANSLKMIEMRKHKVGRAGLACLTALLVGLAVGVPWTIYNQYKRGVNMADKWANQWVPTFAPRETVTMMQRMQAQGTMEETRNLSFTQRLARIRPLKWNLVLTLLIGMALVVLLAIARLRIPKWPIHPVLFLVWIAWAPGNFVSSFLIGWLLKVLVMHFGGIRVFHKLKPVIIGLVAGELIGAMIPI
ncbi:MAG: hypothetical protein D6820_16220, partial [Lentisphaerae bacterium]